METDSKNQIIKLALEELVRDTHADIDVEDADEVVYSYVAGILEESISEVDVEEFVSIMDAYVPGFAMLKPDRVKSFMKRLHISLTSAPTPSEEKHAEEHVVSVKERKTKRKSKRTTSRQSSESESVHMAMSPPNYSMVISRNSQRTVSETSCGDEQWPDLLTDSTRSRHASACRTISVSSTTSAVSNQTDSDTLPDTLETSEEPTPYSEPVEQQEVAIKELPENSEVTELVEQLVEMFPDKCMTDIERALQHNHNNLEETVLSLLDPSSNTVITSNQDSSRDSNVTVKLTNSKQSRHRKNSKSSHKKSNSQSRDEVSEELSAAPEMKSLIVNKYSYIPTDSEQKTHKPKLVVNDEKKMVRYRNGQVVSMKGERYSDAKAPVTDDMKKTFINLKPAKQYRFH